MEPAASPAKRARRTALQRAAAGSMDIRERFRESAAAAASPRPASTVLPDLSAAQVRVLMTWTFAAALAARDAWARFQASDGPLLFQANLQLLLLDFDVAFDICVPLDDEGGRTMADVKQGVLAALDLALACWRAQEAADL